ncbi:ecdysteroid 22-kinase family protein [Mycolicibacterium pyrenivorans]|uniref:ecdysteroid 22-kinase family protein n=1 Tax=Mycolicibacterium pyrenivorans TaxID=187102 RepID=UPI0021F360CD|nr:ecdysteroid 22-kinase family protein [Mycolicibacterium pyrenivorans]MCV7154413.1 phosphotransferase [Mycolicibacterium pyrenivorans]
MARTADLVERPADLTTDWLSVVLGGAVAGFTFERIGTGQMSECYRISLTYVDGDATGPESVVLKVAATDSSSRQTGLALGLYEREVRFYTDIAPGLSGPVAPCHHAAYDPETGAFDLLLGDAAPAAVGDELRGATVDEAALAVAQLGRVHGTLLGDVALAGAEWLNRESPLNQALVAQLWAGFSDRYGETIAPAHRVVCERLVAAFDAHLAAEASADRVHGLIHGDYRLDNMLFGRPGADRPLTVVDWQTVTWGPAFTDLAYFLGCALPAETRRDHYDALLRAYHQALGEQTPIDLDTVRDGVRRQSFFGVMMAIVSSMLVERTDRGDQMFMTMLQRHCDHVLDTDALAVLPEASMPEPLRPAAGDEGPHAPGGEELWNESWYFDFADDRQGVGGWVRLGLVPNQNTAWINALVCGPDMPTVAIVDFAAPLPANPAEVHTETAHLRLDATAPLQTYRVTVQGRGEAFDDPAALLRGEPGRPTELTMDLIWTTAGTPYRYRIAPRYEIACTVSGSVIADGREFRLDAVAGQRDHSWGVRDWWSMDWVWNALHLDDGTHIHGVDIRIPSAPPMSVGYLQPAGAPLAELTEVSAKAVFADNGLPVATTLTLQPADLTLEVDIRGHAPVQLTAADGRVSQFPRAWAAITTGDGRTGIGWLEWNRNAR